MIITLTLNATSFSIVTFFIGIGIGVIIGAFAVVR